MTHRHLAAAFCLAAEGLLPLGLSPVAPAVEHLGSPASHSQPDSVVYWLDPMSLLEAHAGKAGLLAGLGHEHRVRAHGFRGQVVYFPAQLQRSYASVTVLSDSLRVVPEADSADIPKITQAMRTQTLRVASFPEITFVSREVELLSPSPPPAPASPEARQPLEAGRLPAPETGPAGWPRAIAGSPIALRVAGDLTLVGVTRRVQVELALSITPDTLRARGRFALKQTDFGIKPYRTALGLVRVKDQVEVDFDLVAIARP